MLKVGSKRRRTKAEIEEQKQDEITRQEQIEAELQELANLRGRVQQAEGRAQQAEALVQQAEEQANNNRGAADLISQMINANHIIQDSQNSIIIKGA